MPKSNAWPNGCCEAPAAFDLKVMRTGLGSGKITSSPAGIDCGNDCENPLRVRSPYAYGHSEPGSVFVRWEGDVKGSDNPCTILVDKETSVRAVFDLASKIPELKEEDLIPKNLADYLDANPIVNFPARFLMALPPKFKEIGF